MDTKQRIMDEALTLFSEKGYANVFVENIAEREKNSSEELARYYAIIEQTQLFICTFQGGNLQFAC